MFGWCPFLISNNKMILTVGLLCSTTVYLIYQCGLSENAVKMEPIAEFLQTRSFNSNNSFSYQSSPLCALNSKNLSSGSSKITPNLTSESLNAVEERFKDLLDIGGFYRPTKCKARYRVCVIIPYRNREEHLSVFLKNFHPFLMKQNLEYKIIVVEQTAGRPFNRGALFNVGFIEANKIEPWDYFVLHDVDLLPIDNRNIYICSKENPRHLTVAIDKFHFRLLYEGNFGGGVIFTADQFLRVNGYSNRFWGWGGEDDDLYNRIKNSNYTADRYSAKIAKYISLKHDAAARSPDRFNILSDGPKYFKSSGLNSLKYDVKKIEKRRTHTWILVDIIPDKLITHKHTNKHSIL